MVFSLGQRWISDSESELGLGTVVAVEGRMITVLFPATGENRLYAKEEAPVTRVIFNVGDEISHVDGWQMTVSDVAEQNGLLVYHGVRHDNEEADEIKEVFLNHFLKFNKPQDRLFAGQIDRFDRFVIRHHALWQQYNTQQSSLRGLLGAKVSLIAHQLYIAKEVGRRFAPRVMLADEVGLGKTIEAGLIIHQQITAGLAQRVLIVVPETLQHQWLVEMLRRFNLPFSLFDEERCVEAYADSDNPFDTAQLVLVSLDFLRGKKRRFEQLCDTQWDLLVVDEAHHLKWDDQHPSRAFQIVEALSDEIPGVLLLTATPDQMGHHSHFARLRLLDAERFHDYDAFLEEEKHYHQLAELAAPLIDNELLTQAQLEALTTLSGITLHASLNNVNSEDELARTLTRHQLFAELLDCHGTGRVMFRNTRSAVPGFKPRRLHTYAMPLPSQYKTALRVHTMMSGQQPIEKRAMQLLYPEALYQSLEGEGIQWTHYDPRVQWLLDFLLANKQEKVLVICASANTALAIEEAARTEEGIRGTVFHEGMSIIERDKAGAYFAQEEAGAQLMVCSEIGSEGRNFQFARHLVLFDLPTNPDLLEQRIGRLDRIGQRHEVAIHVPYMEHTAQERLLQWYHRGLNAFEAPCSTGNAIYQKHGIALLEQLVDENEEPLLELIETTRNDHQQLLAEMEAGRDRLLEMHSSGGEQAAQLIEEIAEHEGQPQFINQTLRLFDVLGLQQDDIGEQIMLVKPTEQMLVASLPGLNPDGQLVTFDRDTALHRDEVALLSEEHPLVEAALDAILSAETGSTSVALLRNNALPAGSFFLECLFVVETSAPPQYQISQYLPATPIRVLLDKNGNDLSNKVAFETFNHQLSAVNRHIGSKLVNASQTQIHSLINQSQELAKAQVADIVDQARLRAQNKLGAEFSRLTALKQRNPAIRDDELDFWQSQQSAVQEYLDQAQIKLDALRFIVIAPTK
ncbi:RNA polymerase-associated protein RapA [Celerinatantimonas yamalensis]|uniref:RNA polymerase-associated protein RapA n=1 Tax=Celerinatantimonas yamalensis TaxID=559956 RepID=A0ABW9GAJ7_9GAMM